MSTTTYESHMRRNERNRVQVELGEDFAVMTPSPRQLAWLAEHCPWLEVVEVEWGMVAIGPVQLDRLAVELGGNAHPVARGLSLILDLEDRVYAGQSPVGRTSLGASLVNTVAITAIQAQGEERPA